MLNSPLGGKYMIKSPLGNSQRRVAIDWWLAGGIDAANCIAAYQPKGAADYATSKVNLANSGTYDAYEGTAPDWDAVNGWDFVAYDDLKHLWTGIIPENDQTWSMIVRFSDSTQDRTQAVAGCTNIDGTGSLFIITRRQASDDMIFANGDLLVCGSRQSSGISAIAGTNCFHDAVNLGSIPSGWTVPANEIAIGGRNRSSGAGGKTLYTASFDGCIQAMAIYDIDISAYVAELTTAMNAL